MSWLLAILKTLFDSLFGKGQDYIEKRNESVADVVRGREQAISAGQEEAIKNDAIADEIRNTPRSDDDIDDGMRAPVRRRKSAADNDPT